MDTNNCTSDSSDCKQCATCGEQYPRTKDYFHPHPTGHDGFLNHCRWCIARKRGRSLPPMSATKPGHKRCRKCREEKPLTEFYPDTRANDGLASHCRLCNLAYRVKQIGKNAHLREVPFEPDGMRFCLTCKTMKPVTEFGKVKGTPRHRCFDCRKIESTEWRKENPEIVKQYREQHRGEMVIYQRYYHQKNRDKHLEQSKQYRLANPEKAKQRIKDWRTKNPEKYKRIRVIAASRRRARQRQLPDTFTNAEWQHALDYFHNCCAVCGRQLVDLFGERKAHADHWIPLIHPDCPGTIAKNIVPLCGGVDGCNTLKNANLPLPWLTERYGKRRAAQIMRRIQSYFDSL